MSGLHSHLRPRQQKVLVGLGTLVVLAGLIIPSAWFVPLSRPTDLPKPPISGFALVQICLLVEGLVLVWHGFTPRRVQTTGLRRVPMPVIAAQPPEERRVFVWLLAGATLLGCGLRMLALGSDLWLDEIVSILAFRDATVWQVAITPISFNNHLLNTLLVKGAVALLGESEWVHRLPAMIWGTATIPVLYWVARQAMSRHGSLSAAVLLAVSYHHIFFSQNARGYSAYLFLSLMSSGLLVKALSTDVSRIWVAYVATMVLNFTALLISGFVFAAHVIVSGVAVLSMQPADGQRAPIVRRLLGVFVVAAFFGFQIYAPVLPDLYVMMRSVYADPAGGFSPFSSELVVELVRGLSAGFGTGVLLGLVPFVGLAGAGYMLLVRRHWILVLALTLPCLLQAVFFAVQGLVFYPRMFILALPLVILVCVHGIAISAAAVARFLKRDDGFAWWMKTAAVVSLCVASVAALPRYYSVPKQPYRASLAYVEVARAPEDIVIAIHLAEGGVRYYAPRIDLDSGATYYARTVESLDAILAAHPSRPSWLVTTFPRALRLGVPELDARIKRDWEVVRTFPATIGDGQISVWRQKQ